MNLISWTGIDVNTNADYYVEFLDRCSANEQIKLHKQRCHELLEIAPGHFVLDAGCGTGADARDLVQYVGRDGCVLGIDKSAAMIDACTRENSITKNLIYRQEDIFDLQLQDNTFDRCSIHRVLQHLHDPLAALAELERVLKPDGLLLICDPDWQSLQINDLQIKDALTKALQVMIPNYDIVYRLPDLIEQAGLTLLKKVSGELILADYREAEQVLLLREANKVAAVNGWLNPEEIDSWLKKTEPHRRAVKISGSAFLARKRG